MTAQELVKSKWPRATARYFTASCDWEIYATEDTETSLLLGSGRSYPTTPEQDEVNYVGTEESAWGDAAINVAALWIFGELAREIMDSTGVHTIMPQEDQYGFLRETCRKIYDAQVPHEFRAMAVNIRTQDNAVTADPLFVVYQKERIYGMDTDYADTPVWVDSANDYHEANERETKALERYFNYFGRSPRNWTRTAYIERDRFTTATFTRAAAEHYIKSNAHNLKRPFIFVESLYRNCEMIKVRNFLEAL